MEPLFEGESLALFLAKDHRLAAKPIVTAQDLRGEVHLTWGRDRNPALYDQLMTRVVRADYRFRDVIQVGHDRSRDLLLAVADRRGVAFGVASFDPDSGDAGIVAHRPVDPPLRMPDTVVAWRGVPRPRGEPRSPPCERSRDSSTRPAAAWIQTQGVSMHTTPILDRTGRQRFNRTRAGAP
jgi:DNA-binding transcriptional LysR family regulator